MIRFSVHADELQRIILNQIAGTDNEPANEGPFVWNDGNSEVVVYPDSLQVRLLPGWLQVQITMDANETGPSPIGVVFFLGRDNEGDGTEASVAFAEHSQQDLVTAWGPALRDAVWGAVLDVLEAAIDWGEINVGGEMVLAGFGVNGVNEEALLFVDVEPRAST